MKALYDRSRSLNQGLAAIREQFQLPGAFPPKVEDAASAAAAKPADGHVDRTALPFVTLDPTSSTDLDQAFSIERSGADLILRYAIADVGWFVADSSPIDAEAWTRGETIYMPDERISLYPPRLSEGAASLLPDGNRPAVLFSVRVSTDGGTSLDGVERAIVRSRAKLGYATVQPSDLPDGFAELSRRIEAAELERGASRVDPPQQQVVEKSGGGFELAFRPVSPFERANAAMSLAANLAIADALYRHKTGLFRVMPSPNDRAVRRLRQSARAFGIDWPASMSLEQRQRDLDPNDPRQAAFMLAIRRSGERASYAPYRTGERPWHSAMCATYVHATAPLRRLADRYVNEAALAVAVGRKVPNWVTAAFERLPKVMNRADAKASQVDSAVLELAEAVVLAGRAGDLFQGTVTDIDERGARIQIADPAVITRVGVNGLELGESVRLRLQEVDPVRRLARFALA
ncbi:MAG TPA: RNB domain-containing ribonuclease [Sphingomicrobium sp.]|nr:RNB domain-containing ribonuclease [Sphingomicrobium sp.]